MAEETDGRRTTTSGKIARGRSKEEAEAAQERQGQVEAEAQVIVRPIVLLLGIGMALLSAYVTGNFVRIRWYLAAQGVYTLVLGGYRVMGGSNAATAYYWLYTLLTLPILVAALAVASEANRFTSPRMNRLAWQGGLLVATVGFLATMSLGYAAFFSFIGSTLALAGIRTLVGVEKLKRTPPPQNECGSAAHRTLGALFVVQSMLFWMLAAGIPYAPERWNQIGAWVPAVPIVVACFLLIRDFHTAQGIPVYVQARSRG